MAEGLPEGFCSLELASKRMNKEVDIMGVVTDYLPSCKTKKTDFQCTFDLTDWSFTGLRIKYFRPKEEQLPVIRSTGDVVLLRRMNVITFNGNMTIISTYGSKWIVFPASTIPENVPENLLKIPYICKAGTETPNPVQCRYAISLCNSQDRTTFQESALAKTSPTSQYLDAAPSAGRKSALVKDLVDRGFYDLFGEVVRTYPPSGDRLEIYITDYTSNPLLYNYERERPGSEEEARDGDAYGYVPRGKKNSWPGPYGKMTLQVTLWPPHSTFAYDAVKPSDFIWLRNVRAKYNNMSTLEGTMYNDGRYPNRIDIGILDQDDKRVKEILERRDVYRNKSEAEGIRFADDIRGQKRKAGQNGKGQPKGPKSKARKRKKEEEELKKRERDLELAAVEKWEKHGINTHIRCSHPQFNHQTLSEILDPDRRRVKTPIGIKYILPFENIKTRAIVRVIDFFPPKLEDFAVRCEDNEKNGSSDDEAQKSKTIWEWRFCLLVEDGGATQGAAANGDKPHIKVLVHHHDAECLLKLEMDAQDLRKNNTALSQLREKLFILWGDLEERKSAASSSPKLTDSRNAQPPHAKAFECCLMEYGVRVPLSEAEEASDLVDSNGMVWERRFKMFGTTIM